MALQAICEGLDSGAPGGYHVPPTDAKKCGNHRCAGASSGSPVHMECAVSQEHKQAKWVWGVWRKSDYAQDHSNAPPGFSENAKPACRVGASPVAIWA